MVGTETFSCPGCRTTLVVGVTACPRCGTRLTGPDAARLWQVHQQIAGLEAEADRLLARLSAAPGVPDPTEPPSSADPSYQPYPAESAAAHATAGPRPRSSVSGQQLLLGLGALLLLSAVSVFAVVVWIVVGLAGQALIMLGLTAGAVAASAVATTRRLPAAAETAAVIATGLLLLDLAAARGLGLAGLDDVPGARYGVAASLLAGALLLGFDRVVPRSRDEQPLRRVVVYRPAAALASTLAPWSALAALTVEGAALVAGFGLVALADLAVAAVARRTDRPRAPGPARLPASAVVALCGAALAAVLFLVLGLSLGYDLEASTAQRYAAAALLALLPLGLAVAASRRVPVTLADTTRAGLPVVTLGAALLVLGVPLLDAPWWLLVLLAVPTALAVVAGRLAERRGSVPRPGAEPWLRALVVLAQVVQPLLLAAVLAVRLVGEESGADAVRRVLATGAPPGQAASGGTLAVAAVPALLWAVTAVVSAAVRRSGWSVAIAHVAAYATVASALLEAPAPVWAAAMTAALAADVALASYAARRGEGRADRLWSVVELGCVLAGAAYTATALLAASDVGARPAAAVSIAAGVLVVVHAASPGRLAAAYPGSVLISAGTALLASEADVGAVEVYTGPLAVMLALIGLVQRRRDPAAPTSLTAGPALSVAIGPTLLAGLGGDELRLAVGTLAAVVVLLVGLRQRWKAPTTTGAIALVVVGVTQGGPLVAYVPGWLTLGLAGAVLLAAGVAWERAVLAGRRTGAWYATLR